MIPGRGSAATTGYLLVFTAAVLWALIGLFSRTLMNQGMGPLEVSFWRAVIAGCAFGLHASLAGRLRLQRGSDLGKLALFALVGITLFYPALTLATEQGGVSLASVLLYTAPAFVVLLAWPLLGERIDGRKLALVAVATVGVVLVARAGGEGVTPTPAALAWGLASGLSYASYYLFGKWVLQRYAPVTVFAFVMPIGALGLLPFVSFTSKTPQMWLLLVALALVSTYLAYLIYYNGLRHVEAGRAVLVATVEPVLAAALAALVFAERLGWIGWMGAGLIVAAAAIATLPNGRKPTGTTPSSISRAQD